MNKQINNFRLTIKMLKIKLKKLDQIKMSSKYNKEQKKEKKKVINRKKMMMNKNKTTNNN